MKSLSSRVLMAAALVITTATPVMAADVAAGAAAGLAAERPSEVRRYYMDTGRAYGVPVTYYALITPAPPSRFVHIDGARGPARIEIDDRPPFPGPDWIKLIK
jgi:hypothetical protein